MVNARLGVPSETHRENRRYRGRARRRWRFRARPPGRSVRCPRSLRSRRPPRPRRCRQGCRRSRSAPLSSSVTGQSVRISWTFQAPRTLHAVPWSRIALAIGHVADLLPEDDGGQLRPRSAVRTAGHGAVRLGGCRPPTAPARTRLPLRDCSATTARPCSWSSGVPRCRSPDRFAARTSPSVRPPRPSRPPSTRPGTDSRTRCPSALRAKTESPAASAIKPAVRDTAAIRLRFRIRNHAQIPRFMALSARPDGRAGCSPAR